jgi:hypothetical protein
MAILSQEDVMKIYAVIVETGFYRYRDVLLAGIDQKFVASLALVAAPGPQILMDLNALNAVEGLDDGSVPLIIWLRNAWLLVLPERQSAVFYEMSTRSEDAMSRPDVRRWLSSFEESYHQQMSISLQANPLERRLPNFRGGRSSGALSHQEFVAAAGDFLDTLLYRGANMSVPAGAVAREFADNAAFWDHMLSGKHHQMMRVRLNEFHLLEWLPLSPGRYYTDAAKGGRTMLLELSQMESFTFTDEDGVLLPAYKFQMILDGVGSLRLRAREISGKHAFFLGATSTGVSHQGVPVLVDEQAYRQLIQSMKSHGGLVVNIEGVLQLLPPGTSPFVFHRRLPRYCVVVDRLNVVRSSRAEELNVSVAAMFRCARKTTRHGRSSSDFSWTFCSFCPAGGQKSLEDAVDWIERYALRYGNEPRPVLFGDFDEYCQHFDGPVVLSLKELLDDFHDARVQKKIEGYVGEL